MARFDASSDGSHELLIIDPDVMDIDVLLAGLSRPMDAVILQKGRDPLAQIAKALSCRFGLHRLHVLANGEPGALFLGGIRVDCAYLEARRGGAAGTISFSLRPAAEVALWAGNVAQGSPGISFVETFEEITGAKIHASVNVVGAATQGGTWDIGAASPFTRETENTYDYVLTSRRVNQGHVSDGATYELARACSIASSMRVDGLPDN